MKAAKKEAAKRLETLNMLDLVLAGQFDKGARKALTDTKQALRDGL